MYFKVNYIKIVGENICCWSVATEILRTSINNIYFLFCSKVVRQFVRLGTGGDFLGSTNKYSGDREGYPFVIGNVFGDCNDPGTIPPFYAYLEVVRSSRPCCPIPNCAPSNDKLSCTSMNHTMCC